MTNGRVKSRGCVEDNVEIQRSWDLLSIKLQNNIWTKSHNMLYYLEITYDIRSTYARTNWDRNNAVHQAFIIRKHMDLCTKHSFPEALHCGGSNLFWNGCYQIKAPTDFSLLTIDIPFYRTVIIIGSLVNLQGGSSIGLLTGPHNVLINTGLPKDRDTILKGNSVQFAYWHFPLIIEQETLAKQGDNALGSILLSVRWFVWVYSGYIIHHYNSIWGTCAPGRRNMHHGAQGRLCFLKNSGDPDDFLFWWFTECTDFCS